MNHLRCYINLTWSPTLYDLINSFGDDFYLNFAFTLKMMLDVSPCRGELGAEGGRQQHHPEQLHRRRSLEAAWGERPGSQLGPQRTHQPHQTLPGVQDNPPPYFSLINFGNNPQASQSDLFRAATSSSEQPEGSAQPAGVCAVHPPMEGASGPRLQGRAW